MLRQERLVLLLVRVPVEVWQNVVSMVLMVASKRLKGKERHLECANMSPTPPSPEGDTAAYDAQGLITVASTWQLRPCTRAPWSIWGGQQ